MNKAKNAWANEEVFFDSDTGMYGIGQGREGVTYEPQFTKVQAQTLLELHRKGAKTFDAAMKTLEAAGFDFEAL